MSHSQFIFLWSPDYKSNESYSNSIWFCYTGDCMLCFEVSLELTGCRLPTLSAYVNLEYLMIFNLKILSVIFTINPIKQLRLLKTELSLEVSEMTAPTSNEPPSANELQENSANQNHFKNDRSSTDQNDSWKFCCWSFKIRLPLPHRLKDDSSLAIIKHLQTYIDSVDSDRTRAKVVTEYAISKLSFTKLAAFYQPPAKSTLTVRAQHHSQTCANKVLRWSRMIQDLDHDLDFVLSYFSGPSPEIKARTKSGLNSKWPFSWRFRGHEGTHLIIFLSYRLWL